MNQVQSQPLPNGAHIGVYEIKSLKHTGPTAILYQVRNEHMNAMEVLAEYFPGDLVRRAEDGRTVECLSEEQKTRFDRGLKRFLEQAERLSEIEHPNVARVYNTLQFNGTGYLVMDNEQGTQLVKLLGSDTTFGQTELEFLLTTVLDGIRHTHEKGIVHGDIHPSNILIKSSGEPLLIGFIANRLAAALDFGDPGARLRSGYAAPELFDSGYTPKPAADIYALGATVYRCITHVDPAPTVDRLSATAKGGVDPVKIALQSAAGDYSEKLINTVLRMLEPSENKRLQTADAVLSELGVAVQDSAASEDSQAKPAVQTSDTSASKPSRIVWIGAAVAILLIVLGLWSTRTNDRHPAEKIADSGQQATEAETASKPAESIEPVMPKTETAVAAPVPEASAVAQAQTGSPGEAVSAPATEASAPVNQTPVVTEQPPVDVTAKAQPQTAPSEQAMPIGEASVPPTEQNDEKQAALNAHLAAAETAFADFRLSTPANDSAYGHYQAVLALDSENTAAKEGIQRIVDRYVWLIDRAIKRGNYRHARAFLERATSIKPGDAALEKLGESLNAAQQ